MLKGIGTVAVICIVLLGLLAHQAAQADEIYIRGGGGPQPVTISNIGDAGSTLEVSDIFIDDDTHFSLVSGGTCDSPPFSLTAGEDCTQMVEFIPQEVGEHDAMLQVLSDAGSINNDTVALNGTGSSGDSAQLAFGTQPSTTLFDAVMSPAVTVEIRDAAGNLVIDDNTTVVSLELTGGEPLAVLSNGGATQAENGVVTFDALSVDLVGMGYQLVASDSLGSLGTDTSNAFNITSSSSTTTIENITPELNQLVGQPYSVEVSVTGVDPTGQVTVSDGDGESCTFNLPDNSCNLTSFVAGVKTITAFYGGDENHASSSDAAVYQIDQASSIVTIEGMDPADEQTVNQPYQVQVSVSGFQPTGMITVSDDDANACTITLPANSCSLTSTTVGTRTITASYPGDINNESSLDTVQYDIVSSGPAGLTFAVEPQLGVLDGPLIPRVVIQVVDSQGIPVTDDNETEVQIVFETNPTDANLSGNPLLTVTNGSVEFPDLSIDRLGQGYQLRAQAPKQGLDPATSSPFDVVEDTLFSDRFEKPDDKVFHDRFER